MTIVETHEGRLDSVSKRRLIAAAMAYIEQFGLEGFSLRAFGAYAHVHNTAIYAHFRSKDDLLAAVFETIASEPREATEPELNDPVDRLRAACLSLRASLRAHPGLVPAFIESTRQPALRVSVSILEMALEALEQSGLSELERLDAARTIETYVLGSAFYDFASAPEHLDQRGLRHRALEDSSMHAAFRTSVDVDSTNEAAFVWGLDALLNSLTRRRKS